MFEVSNKISNLTTIGFDSRNDANVPTFYARRGENGEILGMHKSFEKVHHLTITIESGPSAGTYLTHGILDSGTGAATALKLYEVLKCYNSVDSIEALVCDNTSVNTGAVGGAVAHLEKIVKKKLHKIGCCLHLNELPLRKIITDLDGKSSCGNKLSGPIGSRIDGNIHFKPVVNFEQVESSLQEPPAEIMKDLSNDQQLLLQYVLSISRGHIPTALLYKKAGPCNQARWLTTALRFLILYTRDPEPSANFKKIVKFIMQVYAPSWFNIKTNNDFFKGPAIIFQMWQWTKNLEEPVCEEAVKTKISDWAFQLTSDNFLAAMLFSTERYDRFNAALRIQDIRENLRENPYSQRIPKINFEALKWSNMVRLTDVLFEGQFTQKYPVDEVWKMVEDPRIPPRIPLHSQVT